MKLHAFVFGFFLSTTLLSFDFAEARRRGSSGLGGGGSGGSSSRIGNSFAVQLRSLGDKTITLGKTVEEVKEILGPIAEGKEAFDTIIIDRFTAQYEATKAGTLNEQEQSFLYQQALVDYHHSKCQLTKVKADCDKEKRELDYFVNIVKTSVPDFTYTPQKIDIPTYDIGSKRMTYRGSVYDVKSGQVISTVVTTATAASAAASAARGPKAGDKATKDIVVDGKPGEKPAAAASADENDPLNYTCVWKSDLQRKILRGPSCNSSGTRICSGYVNCTKKIKGQDRAFTRLATCAESLCGDSQAGECSKQPNYGSRNPDAEDSAFTDAKATKKAGAAK